MKAAENMFKQTIKDALDDNTIILAFYLWGKKPILEGKFNI